MKSLILTVLFALNLPAFAHGPGNAHLTFANGDFHAHAQWVAVPVANQPAALKVEWKRASDHAPVAAPGQFIVEPVMCHKPGHCHGTIENAGAQPVLDNKGLPIVGSYIVRDIVFSMNGPWEVRLNLTYPDGTQETQMFMENLGGQHGGHKGHRH